MSNFVLITNRKQFSNEAREVWFDYSPNLPMKGFVNAPHELPCLVSLFIANGGISSVIADKRSAKRIIYPKTNRNRTGTRWFDWVDGDLDEEIRTYVNVVLDKHGLDKEKLLQAANIKELIHKTKGRKGPVLITNRLYNVGDTTVVDFFLVTKELASSLVYCNKNYNKDNTKDGESVLGELLGHDQALPSMFDAVPEEPPEEQHISPENFPFTIHVDREGIISVAPLSIFKTMASIPRFSNYKEADISQWEIACIKDINVILKNTQVDVESTVSIAKVKCKEFLVRRNQLRVSWASMHNDDWINRNKTDPEIRASILQYGQDVDNRNNRRYSIWHRHSG